MSVRFISQPVYTSFFNRDLRPLVSLLGSLAVKITFEVSFLICSDEWPFSKSATSSLFGSSEGLGSNFNAFCYSFFGFLIDLMMVLRFWIRFFAYLSWSLSLLTSSLVVLSVLSKLERRFFCRLTLPVLSNLKILGRIGLKSAFFNFCSFDAQRLWINSPFFINFSHMQQEQG